MSEEDPILAVLARMYTNLHADIEDLRVDVLAELRKTRTEITSKIEGLRDDLSVNEGAVDMTRRVNDNTRDDVSRCASSCR